MRKGRHSSGGYSSREQSWAWCSPPVKRTHHPWRRQSAHHRPAAVHQSRAWETLREHRPRPEASRCPEAGLRRGLRTTAACFHRPRCGAGGTQSTRLRLADWVEGDKGGTKGPPVRLTAGHGYPGYPTASPGPRTRRRGVCRHRVAPSRFRSNPWLPTVLPQASEQAARCPALWRPGPDPPWVPTTTPPVHRAMALNTPVAARKMCRRGRRVRARRPRRWPRRRAQATQLAFKSPSPGGTSRASLPAPQLRAPWPRATR